jgi:CubicO group peptidase (beta-lactamase class C family)
VELSRLKKHYLVWRPWRAWAALMVFVSATLHAAPVDKPAALPVSAPGVVEPRPARPLTREDLEAWLDGYMPYTLQRADIAGAVVVVVKGGEVLFQKGYGFADAATHRPVDPQNTLFRPGSVSKLFTWTAVMQLVEQHRIDLDLDINTYLDFRIPPFDGQPVTMRNLMTHTAGFEDSLKDMVTEKASAPAVGDFLKQQVPHRVFPPGQITGYSNYGAALAGYIVERVSGQPFNEYVEQHILLPLDMHHMTFRQPLPAALAPMMSRGYLAGSDEPEPYEMFGPSPAGGSAATAADMAKFMIAHLQNGEYAGRRILQPETAQMMHDTAFTTVSPALNRMALGFIQSNRNGHRVIGHDGDTRLFHSSLLLFLDDNVGLFVSLNSAGRTADTFDIRAALFEEFTDRYFPAPSPGPGSIPNPVAALGQELPLRGEMPAAVARAHAALMAGHYDGSRREETTFASFVTLLSQVTLTADDRGRLVTPFTKLNGEQKTFEEIAPFLWHEVDGKDLLAAKLVNGKVALWGTGDDPTGVYTPTPAWRCSTWLLPLLLFSVAALIVTALAWPITAIVRRHYGAVLPRGGTAARAYRWVHIAAASQSVVIAAWLTIIFGMMATFYITWLPYFINSSMMKWIFIAHVLSVVILPPAALVALWNVRVTFTTRTGWRNAFFSRSWSVVIAASSLTVLYVAVIFHFIGFGVAF